MKKKIHELKKTLSTKKSKQVISLYLVNIIGIPLGLVTSMILTRYLGPKLFGDYSYLNGIFLFAMVIFNFGFLYAGNRFLVLNNDEKKAREIYGSVFVIVVLLFLIMSLSLIIFGYFDKNIAGKGLYTAFLYLIPFGWIYILTSYFETLFQADNRMKSLVFIRFYPKIGLFVACLLIYFFLNNLKIDKLLLVYIFYLSSYIVTYLIALYRIKLSFKNLKLNLRTLLDHNNKYGFDVYIGSILAVGASSLSTLVISYYDVSNSNVGVGFYNLALTFSTPLALIPNVIATTHYKEFAGLNKIPSKLFKTTILLSLGSLLILWIFIEPFIDLFYGKEYHSTVQLTLIISLGVAAHGMADFFNRYLSSHGKGKMLRNSSILVGICLIISNFILIPIWHEVGAVYSRLLSGMVYLINMIFLYKSYTKSKI